MVTNLVVLHGSLLAERALLLLADMSVKSVILIVAAGLLTLVFRRASAAHRHLIWLITLAAALCLALLSALVPGRGVPVVTTSLSVNAMPVPAPVADLPKSRPALTRTVAVGRRPAPAVVSAEDATPAAEASPPPAASPMLRAGLAFAIGLLALGVSALWLLGVLLLVGRMGVALWRLRSLRRGLLPLADGAAAIAAVEALGRTDPRRPVRFYSTRQGSAISVPLTWGYWKPVVVLPFGAAEWPTERLRAALRHEMAHVQRGDWATQMLASLACALYWFNPLVWLAARRMRAESETACDDRVLASGMSAADYAQHLLDVALSVRGVRRLGLGAVAMAQTPRIEGRLRTVLTRGLRRGAVRKRVAAGAVTAALLLALPLSALRVGARVPRIPVPAANRLQLHDGFTLRYAETITNRQTTAMLLREYQQMRQTFQRELEKDPHFQPVPDEFYKSFASYQQRQTQTRHVILTISAKNGRLLWHREEKGHSLTLIYDGRETQWIGDGHRGRIEPGLDFSSMSDCPLPAVGLPYVPLIKGVTLADSAGDEQTWQGQCVDLNGETSGHAMAYLPATIRAVSVRGTWKVLDVDSYEQQLQYFQHRRLQGLWVASRMRLTKYGFDASLVLRNRFATQQAEIDWLKTVRKPTYVCEYRLLSASEEKTDIPADAQPASPPHAARNAVVANPANPRMTLPNGATVRLAGVADTQASGPTRWWAADGSPVTEPLPKNTLVFPALPAGVQGRAFAIETSYNLTAQPKSIWAIPPMPNFGWWVKASGGKSLYYAKPNSPTYEFMPDEHLQDLNHLQEQESKRGSHVTQLTIMPQASRALDKTVILRYAVAAGPWTESITCKKTVGKVYIPTPSGQVIFTLVPNPHHLKDPHAVARGNAIFMVSDHFSTPSPMSTTNSLQVAQVNGENYDRDAVALDAEGRVVYDLRGELYTNPDNQDESTGEYRSAKTVQMADIPNSVLKRVASFRLLARPLQWAEFRDVQLHPRIGSAASSANPAPPTFRRYVSKPLRDGTRYTFLYPAYLRDIHEGGLDQKDQFITVRIDAVGQHDLVPLTHGGVVVMERGTHDPKLVPHEEFCCVVVGSPGDNYTGKSPLRQDRQWVGQDGNHHDVSLTDGRTHMRFRLTHEDRYLPDLFHQTDPVIMSSFRILPPGVAAP